MSPIFIDLHFLRKVVACPSNPRINYFIGPHRVPPIIHSLGVFYTLQHQCEEYHSYINNKAQIVFICIQLRELQSTRIKDSSDYRGLK